MKDKRDMLLSLAAKNNLPARWISENRLLTAITIGMILAAGSGCMYLTTINTVKDRETGLVWQDDEDAKNKKVNWKEAKEYCQNLSLGLRGDWRIPTVKELQTIVDLNRFNPAIKEGFQNVAPVKYWASEYIIGTKKAYLVYFKHGDTGKYSNTAKLGVRCVRGGSGI